MKAVKLLTIRDVANEDGATARFLSHGGGWMERFASRFHLLRWD